MNDLGDRRRRRRARSPEKRTRARRHVVAASAVALLTPILAVSVGASAAMANAATPEVAPLASGSVVLNANGTVTVTATGTWIWTYGVESDTTAGIDATVRHHCDHRTGVGWGIVWNDPNDPGVPETYTTKRGPHFTQMVHVGSSGVDPLNGDSQVDYDNLKPCGTFVETNTPRPGDGYDTGVWHGTHTYASVAQLPPDVCAITYDLGFGHPPSAHRLNFDNNDNSVQWSLFKTGGWDDSPTDNSNCATLPPPVPAPPTPPPPPVRTVSHTVPPPKKVVVKPSTPLAFTGFGTMGRLLSVLGGLLVVLGLVLYFGDVRRAAFWLLGCDGIGPALTRLRDRPYVRARAARFSARSPSPSGRVPVVASRPTPSSSRRGPGPPWRSRR